MARPTRSDDPSDNGVQRTRAWTGFWVVLSGDLAIAAGAAVAIWKTSQDSADTTSMVAILTSAFTAISTMTTAYFGIKTMSNTAQSFAAAHGKCQPAGKNSDDPPDPAPEQARRSPPPARPPAPVRPSAPVRPAPPTGPPPDRPSAPTGPPPATE